MPGPGPRRRQVLACAQMLASSSTLQFVFQFGKNAAANAAANAANAAAADAAAFVVDGVFEAAKINFFKDCSDRAGA